MRRNNFDIVRLFFAFLVIFEHAYLFGLDPIRVTVFGFVFHGYIALQCFFIISGYLIFQSWETSRSLRDYTSKRFRRIYPAYFMIVAGMAILGVFLTTLDPISYFTSKEWIKYLAANLVFLNFLQPTLPGVFTGNLEQAVNSSLWTIKVEVMFYIAVPIVAYMCRYVKRIWVFAAVYVLSLIWAGVFEHLFQTTDRKIFEIISRQTPGQMSFFIAGAFLFYYFDAFRKRAHLYAAIALVVLTVHFRYEFMVVSWLFPMALAVMVIYLAEVFFYLGNFGRFGDMSYGLYIVHYPIFQIYAWAGLFETNLANYLAAATTAFTMSVLSWHFVEKPALLRSSHYRAAEEAGTGKKAKSPKPAAAAAEAGGKS